MLSNPCRMDHSLLYDPIATSNNYCWTRRSIQGHRGLTSISILMMRDIESDSSLRAASTTILLASRCQNVHSSSRMPHDKYNGDEPPSQCNNLQHFVSVHGLTLLHTLSCVNRKTSERTTLSKETKQVELKDSCGKRQDAHIDETQPPRYAYLACRTIAQSCTPCEAVCSPSRSLSSSSLALTLLTPRDA